MATLASIVKIGADISALERGVSRGVQVMEGIDKKATAMGSTMATLGKAVAGAFTVTAIADMGRQALDTASQVQDAADKMGIGAEAVQRLQFAAEQGGASLDNVGTAMAKMSKVLSDGSKGTVENLAALGLNLETIKAMAPDQAFVAIADAIAKVPDPMKQAALAQELLGKGAMALMPAIKAGFTAVGAAAPVMSEAMIKSADDTGDAIAAMHARMENLKARAMLPLLNLFTSMPGPVQTAIGALSMLTPALTGLASLIVMSGGPMVVLGALGTMFTVTLPAAFMAILPFLGPIGIIAVAVGAVVLAWKHWDKITAFVSGIYTAIKTFIIDKIIPILAAGGPLLGPVGMVVTIWKNWDRITEIAKAVYMGVKEWLVDKFMAVVNKIKGAVDSVTGFFADMYDKVVGNSYVPDMIKGIAAEFGKLQGVMVDPTNKAVGTAMGMFERGLAGIRGVMAEFEDDTRSTWDNVQSYISGAAQGAQGVMRVMAGDITGFVDIVVGGFRQMKAAWEIVKGIFNPDAGRDLVEKFVKEFGGFDGIQAIFAQMGEEGHRLWVMLTQGPDVHRSPAAARRAIEEVRDSIERFRASASGIAPITFEVHRIDTYERHGEVESLPEFAGGSGGIRDFGSGTLAMLHGREGVYTEAQVSRMRGGGGRGGDIVIHNSVAGHHVETIIVDALSGKLRRMKLLPAI